MSYNVINLNDINDKYKKKVKVLKDVYDIIDKIGSGSFGDVYLAVNKLNPKINIAAKVEKKNNRERVYNEYKIYKKLHQDNDIVGIPKIYEFVQTSEYNIMFMELLDSSLEDLFTNHNRKFKKSTVLKLGLDIINLMQDIHSKDYIHRDIKPNNFMIGKGNNKNKIYIMDFGLSKRYKQDGKHIRFHKNRSLIGTARYASINMHMGFEPSRRDDLESIGNMLVYFLRGSLPWQGLRKKKGKKHLEAIGNMKMCTGLDILCKDLPKCFKEYLSYCRNLKFDEDPDYDYLKSLFLRDSKKLKIEPQFEWI